MTEITADPAGTTGARSAWSVLRRLLPFLARYQMRVAIAAAALLVASAATLTVPVAFRYLIDLGFAAPAAGQPPAQVNQVFLALFGVAVVLGLGTAVRFYNVSWLGERISNDLRQAVYSHVLRQDPMFFESLKTGEVLSRLSTDTTLIQTLIGTSISLGLRNSLLFVGALGMMIYTSPTLAGLIVGLLLLVVLPIMVFGRRVRKLSRDSQDKLADTGALAGETLNAMQIVQAYAREPLEDSRYSAVAEQAFRSAIRRTRARALLTALAIVLIFGAIVFVLWLGAHAVLEGTMSGGLLTQFMLYAALVAGSTGAIAEVLGDVQRAAGATERLVELLDVQPQIRSGPLTEVPALPVAPAVSSKTATTGPGGSAPAGGGRAGSGASVRFEGVSFNYPSRPGEPALDALSFDVRPGATVALVGPSGAGKTTVFQLLLRFYDPQKGSILINGVDVRELNLVALRESIGLVSQDSVVFSANAIENIRYGRLDATDEEVMAAATAARADEFIQRLPQGYQTYLGERGVRLSGGQRQRIAIARALLKNPPLLLLDEATSALDAESERAVQAALEQAMDGRTTLVIAHRLATVIHADRIMVLEHGRLVEAGTHDTLNRASGLYARLAAMQFDSNPNGET
ncbi:MAG: ABC transporter transmembrane domain-containing protein [Burkholderiaceae bacterium]